MTRKPIQVFLTIDTECSMGGAWEDPRLSPVDPERAVLGKIGSDYYGIPRIMDILEEYGLRGVFFIEVFAGLNGFQPALTEAYSQIVKRGHEVQLHLHPIHYYYRLRNDGHLEPEKMPLDKDMIGAHTLEKQVEMLEMGASLFQEMTGRAPTTFRAGNFGASQSTLEALDKVGICIDSSFNAAYLNSGCMLDSHGAVNRPWRHGHIWEIPVTTFRTGAWGWSGLKQLNINAVSIWE
jgi:peptidoglycan/xylan/chitin deacetylase (PgdA/CDA1 family)